MVTKYTKDGHPYGQAPYTPDEEERLNRHLEGNDGPITIVYSGPTGDRFRAPPPPKSKQKDDDLLD
jgi:hypothetical protein